MMGFPDKLYTAGAMGAVYPLKIPETEKEEGSCCFHMELRSVPGKKENRKNRDGFFDSANGLKTTGSCLNSKSHRETP